MDKTITILIILMLLACCLFLGVKYYLAEVQLHRILNTNTGNVNENVLAFDKLFVDKVLKTQGEISYQDRLNLENAVVFTKDKPMIDAWHSFLASTTEKEAQERVLVLLSMFVDKIAR